ncbi:hypothetical protein [Methanoculleus sp.]|uniref:hypothetical protein n=1 Tax=Methanoculleus sp. TaxID=90427 RepID=UPI001BD38B4C|nr:hypothetical protein [Methanoculleus sp.]
MAGLSFLLGPLIGLLGAGGVSGILAALPIPATIAGLSALGFAVSVLAGLVIGGLLVWGLWKFGVIQAVEDAGAGFMRFAQNTLTILGNLKDNIIEWFTLVTQSAGLWGANFALSWIEGIVSNIPFLGDLLAPQINSLHTALDSAGADLQARWDKWNAGGGFVEGLTEGTFTGANTTNRSVSDFIASIDSLVFGTGTSSRLTAADREARLNDLYGGAAPVAFPTPQPVVGAAAPAAGETNYITPVNVTVNVTGSQAQGIDERRLAEVIQHQITDALRGRSR